MKLRIVVKTRKQAQFWIRAFKLEPEIERVQAMLDPDPRRKWAAVPVISEFTVDEEMKFYYAVVLMVDSLGLKDGMGWVFLTDKKSEPEVKKARDDFADDVMKDMEKKPFDEIIEIETRKEE